MAQFKIGKIKTGRNGAAYKRIVATGRQAGGEPVAGGYYTLKAFAIIGVTANPVFNEPALLVNFINDQCIAIIEMPNFIAFNAVKSRELIMLQ